MWPETSEPPSQHVASKEWSTSRGLRSSREGQAEAAFHGAGFRGGAHFHVPTWPGPRRPGAIQAGHIPGGWERNRPAAGQTDGGMDEA